MEDAADAARDDALLPPVGCPCGPGLLLPGVDKGVDRGDDAEGVCEAVVNEF